MKRGVFGFIDPSVDQKTFETTNTRVYHRSKLHLVFKELIIEVMLIRYRINMYESMDQETFETANTRVDHRSEFHLE